MIGDDQAQLAALWQTPMSQGEDAAMARLTRRTPRLARVVQYGELAVVLVLGVAVAGAMLWRLGAETLLTGSLVLLLLGWSAWQRHRLAHMADLVDGRDRFSFLSTSVQAKEAELKRSAMGLALILPGTMLTTLLIFSVAAGGGALGEFIPAAWLSPRGIISIGFLAAAIMLLSLSHLRLIAELGRLQALREAYLHELQRDASPGD